MENTANDSNDGIPRNNPDRYWNYRFELMIEAASAMQGVLEFLVNYNQKHRLTQLLLTSCDLLEFTIDRRTGKLLEYRFRICFSDRIALQYSSRPGDCRVYLDGEKDSFPTYFPENLEALSRILEQLWEDTRMLPIWKIVKEDPLTICISQSNR